MLQKFILILICGLLFNSKSFSQEFQSSVLNYLKAGTGEENYGEGGAVGIRDKKFYENVTDLRIFIPSFSFGLRFEKSNPPEFGIPRNGIIKKFVSYENNGLSLRAGSVNELFSKGLSLNLFENRSLAFDTGIDGLKAIYENNNLNLKFITGKLKYLEPLTLFEVNERYEYYNLTGAFAENKITDKIKLSGSVIYSKGDLLNESTTKNEAVKSILPEVGINFEFDNFSFLTSVAYKFSEVNNKNFSGTGIYSSLQHYSDWYGIVFEYKNYLFDDVAPEERNNFKRPTRALPFQNPPIVHKEHSYTTLQRYPHVVDFNDEVGWQIDAFFSILDQTTLNFNFAQSSRHNEFEIVKETWSSTKLNSAPLIFPSFKNVYSPFNEVFFEVEHFFKGEENYFKSAINRREEIIYDIFNPLIKTQPLKTLSVPFELQYILSDNYSFKTNIETQWVTKFPINKEYRNNFITLQITKSLVYNFGVRYEITTSSNEPNNEKNWLVFESSIRIGKNNTLLVSYGKERGGQICSNGICRTQLPFSGARIALTSAY